MVWQIEKRGRTSFLVGTAHFFPYSFKSSLTRLLEKGLVALFEGPLDQASMDKVVKAGFEGEEAVGILGDLDESTIAGIERALAPTSQGIRSLMSLHLLTPVPDPSVSSMVKGMKHWMAFFTIYSRFLAKNGWNYSVDMEAYTLAREMGKQIVFMETIEEQIDVLETLSRAQIIDFLKRIDHWHSYTRNFVTWYVNGELETMASNPYGFPTRNPWVIDRRDRIFYERMVEHLERGGAIAFVGTPHVVGIKRMLAADGYDARPAHP